MIFIEADMRPLTNVLGTWNETVEAFSNRRNLETMTLLAAETATQGFNEYMDSVAVEKEQELGHMYDWGELGRESGRLWRVLLGGTQTNKIVTFDYKQSVNEVPVGVNSEDTRKGGHVFRWKAPVIENGIRVRIEPVNGQWLAIPTAENSSNMTNNVSKGGTMWFTKRAISPPINRIAQGAFTQAWLIHFSTVAVRIVEETVVREAEQFFNTYETIYKQIPKAKTSRKPKRPMTHLENKLGHYLGRKKNGTFMTKMELAEQALRIQRISDGIE